MAFDDPVWVDGLSYSGQEMRRAEAMTLMANGTAGGSLGGVRPGDPGLLVTLAGMAITVAAGVAAVPYSGQGVYRAYNASAWTGTVATAHASLTRIDLVYLRVYDGVVDSSGQAKADVVYLAGTPGSGGTPTPSGTQIFIPLAQITVPPSSTTPSVLDMRPMAVAPGGITPNGSVPGLYVGQWRDNPYGGALERWNGSAWVTYAQQIGGIAPATLASGSYTGQYRDNTSTGVPDRWSGSAWVPTNAGTDYTPVWSGLSALGAATAHGRYLRDGKRCKGIAELTWGTGSSLGTGFITVSLPFTASSAPGGNLAWHSVGRQTANDGSTWKELRGRIAPGGNSIAVYGIRASDVGWQNPGQAGYLWGTAGANMCIDFDYEIA